MRDHERPLGTGAVWKGCFTGIEFTRHDLDIFLVI